MRNRTRTKRASVATRLKARLARRTDSQPRHATSGPDRATEPVPGAETRATDGSGTPARETANEPVGLGCLAALVGPVHRDAARLASWVAEGGPRNADPRQIHHAGDAAVAAMCQHLATMDRLVYPEISEVLPHTAGTIARLRADAREMLGTMRDVEQIAQGDTHSLSATTPDVRRGFLAAISDHGQVEEELLREYDEAAPAWRQERLVTEYERMLPRAPSRPHPHLARGPLAGALGFGVLGRFDELLDTLDARELPWAPVRAPRKVGPWGAWLLGQPPRAAARREQVPAATAPAAREHQDQRRG